MTRSVVIGNKEVRLDKMEETVCTLEEVSLRKSAELKEMREERKAYCDESRELMDELRQFLTKSQAKGKEALSNSDPEEYRNDAGVRIHDRGILRSTPAGWAGNTNSTSIPVLKAYRGDNKDLLEELRKFMGKSQGKGKEVMPTSDLEEHRHSAGKLEQLVFEVDSPCEADDDDGTCNILRENSPIISTSGYEKVPKKDDKALIEAGAKQPGMVATNVEGLDFQVHSQGSLTGNCGLEFNLEDLLVIALSRQLSIGVCGYYDDKIGLQTSFWKDVVPIQSK